MLGSGEIPRALRLASLPLALRDPPLGSGWLFRWLPPDSAVLWPASLLLVASLVMALLGWWSRLSLASSALLGVYVLGVPQLFGDSVHYHHLLWIAALTSAGPCGDALSLDAWLARRRGEALLRRRRVYAAATVPLWLALALVYFFPGLAKLTQGGWAWIAGPHLLHLMHEKWWIEGQLPPWRPDRWPWLLHLAAAGVVALELSFPLLVLLSARSRQLVAWAGLAFHTLNAVFLHIRFGSLVALYVVFFDWRTILRSVRSHAGWTPPTAARRRAGVPKARGALVASVSILGGIAIAGFAAEMRGWPFACYPTFSRPATGRIDALRAEGWTAAGERRELWVGGRRRGADSGRWWALTNRALHDPPESTRLLELVSAELAAAQVAAPELVGLRLTRATYVVAPDRWADPPVAEVVLAELTRPRSGSAVP